MTPPNHDPSGPTGTRDNPRETHESNQHLWLLVGGPLIWSAHFLASYITAAIWCAKAVSRDGSLTPVRFAILVYTVLAILGIGVMGWIGYRRHSYGEGDTPHDEDTPEDRHRFLGFATLLLSGLSVVATIYVALAAVFLETCH